MPLVDFLLRSRAQPDLPVGHPSSDTASTDAELESVLLQIESDARLNCPGTPPALNMPAAIWAARTLYALAQALAFRELDAKFIAAIQAIPCPAEPSPEVCWSVDLSFSLLPDLARLAGAISQDDPLTLAIKQLGTTWPLSSVGMRGIENPLVSSFFEHPALRRLCVDRILRTGDTSRLQNTTVAAAVTDALGAHRSIAPAIALALPIQG